jgi:alkylhydroperoxidase family enzyme
MTRIPLSDVGTFKGDRMLGNRPELLQAWGDLEQVLVGPSSTLPPELKEQVRRTLAQEAGCEFCASLGRPDRDISDVRTSLAVGFAQMAAADHKEISDAQIQVLLDEFTVEQTVELLTYICFKFAGQMLGSLMGNEAATEQEREQFAAWVAAQPAPVAG